MLTPVYHARVRLAEALAAVGYDAQRLTPQQRALAGSLQIELWREGASHRWGTEAAQTAPPLMRTKSSAL